jgi:tRNA dimethylallyltransferase
MRLLALVGPTASGKTEASVLIARALDAEIVSIDPALAYRGMDAWTAKPSPELRSQTRHHLLDVADPVAPVGVKDFQRQARCALLDIEASGHPALLVGASGLFFRAIVDDLEFPPTDPRTRALLDAEALIAGPEQLFRRLADLDPAAAARIQPANARRIVRALEVAAVTGQPFSSFAAAWTRYDPRAVTVAGIDVDRAALRRRIDARARAGFDDLLTETASLLDAGFGSFVRSGHVIGYAEAAACLDGRLSAEEATALIARRDRALARRQLAWFRRDPRVRWFPAGDGGALTVVDQVVRYLRRGGGSSIARSRARLEG